jgi:hypothetical protein
MCRPVGLVAGVALAALSFAGCGSSPAAGAVKATSAHLHDVRSGVLDLKMIGSLANGLDPSGFEVNGPFAVAAAQGRLPTAELTYTQISGVTRSGSTVILTGTAGFVVDKGVPYTLTDVQLTPLRATGSSGGNAGLAGLNVAAWAKDLKLSQHADLDTVTGTVDPVAAMNDLLALAARLGNDASVQPPRLQGSDASDFKTAVRAARLTLTTGHRDRLLHRLQISFDLAGPPGSRLRAALGKLANVHLSVDLSLDNANRPVHVTAPTNPRPIAERPRG